jgi:hypothetical protein
MKFTYAISELPLRTFSRIRSRALHPITTRAIRLRDHLAKHECWRAGYCRFYGPASFLKLCANAIEQLSMLDQSVFLSLIEMKLCFGMTTGAA